MGNWAKIFILACGLFFVCLMFNMLIKRKINEKNSIIWIIGTLSVLALSSAPDFLDYFAEFIGIKYPPALLFLLSTLVLLYISLQQSAQISTLSMQLKELSQNVVVERAKKAGTKDDNKEIVQ